MKSSMMRSNIMPNIFTWMTRNEDFGRFYNFGSLVKGKYGVRINKSRWELPFRSGLGLEFQLGKRYITFKRA